MNLNNIMRMLRTEYAHAQCCSFVRKPMSYALYQVWKYVDKKEKGERTMTRFEAIKELSIEEFAKWITVAIEQPICEAIKAHMGEEELQQQCMYNLEWLNEAVK